MPKSDCIELMTGEKISILYEDRSVVAIDKPRGWMLAPDSWTKTGRNLQAALRAGIARRDYWASSRNLKFLRFIHRLDAETTGIVLMARSLGAVPVFSKLFESRSVEKVYLAVVYGIPKCPQWSCHLKMSPDPATRGKMKVDPRHGKDAETKFRVLQSAGNTSLVEACPTTGRTHQIRVHLAESGYPVIGDDLYGKATEGRNTEMRLRAGSLEYVDPFTKRKVKIHAPMDSFLKAFGFDSAIGWPSGKESSDRTGAAGGRV